MFIKVGNRRINTDHVKSTLSGPGQLLLVVDNFDPGGALAGNPASLKPVLLFVGEQAERVERALDRLSVDASVDASAGMPPLPGDPGGGPRRIN